MPEPDPAAPTAPALHGIRVLDLASVGPAARASRLLADYGADVVKVGPVPRRGGVQIVPPFHAYGGHRGMRRVLLDLKDDDGRGAFLRLAERADVVIESFRPGVMDRLGLGWPELAAVNPRLVYCSTSGYGQTGPASQWAGHDINYLAASGFLALTQPRADGGPPIPGLTVADSAAGGMHAVMAILAALVRRSATGEGSYLDVSVADGMVGLMALMVDEYLATGTEPHPGHYILTGRYACYDLYPTADGRWLSLGAIEPHFWANLCRLLDLPRWIEHQTDDAVQDEIRADLRAVFATRSRDEWTALLAPADTCVAPVLEVAEIVDDPQVQARHAIVGAEHPTAGPFRQVGAVWAGSGPLREPVMVPDVAATHTDDLLADAGYDATSVADLRERGVVA
ncbi:MAG: CoA transferase [Acidimicrobiales bacterium]|nr:CoA transferase [Acidimicrobiales bacterium]